MKEKNTDTENPVMQHYVMQHLMDFFPQYIFMTLLSDTLKAISEQRIQ